MCLGKDEDKRVKSDLDKSVRELLLASAGKNSGVDRMPFHIGRKTIVYKSTKVAACDRRFWHGWFIKTLEVLLTTIVVRL